MIDKCGKYLGEGFRRIVYQYTDNPNLVIKFLKNLEDNHNKIEYENWNNLKDTEKGVWLVPCLGLSADGRFLIQERVEVLDKAPDEIPDWIKVLGDYSFGGNNSRHWGIYNDRVVLIDYGDKLL